jgi:hypothetical protein
VAKLELLLLLVEQESQDQQVEQPLEQRVVY